MDKEELISIRNGVGVSQQLFSKITGIGIASVKRYETGTSRPTRAHQTIYNVLLYNKKTIHLYIDANKIEITPRELKNIYKYTR